MVDKKKQDKKVDEQEVTAPESAVPEEAAVAAEEGPEEKEQDLQTALDEARAEAEDYLDQLRRARADYANYKRRIEQEKKELLRYASAGLVTKLLPVLDDFERAFQTLPEGLDRLTWSEGIALIHRKLQMLLESEGLETIDVAGQKFDPVFHEAISYEEREDMEDGAIIAEVQKGYKLGERVLRPALVRVAKHVGKAEETAGEEKDEQGE